MQPSPSLAKHTHNDNTSDGTNSNNAVASQKRRMKRGRSNIVNAVDSFDAHGSVSHMAAYSNKCSLPTDSDSRLYLFCQAHGTIGLYRDVWIAAIASSRTSLTTLRGVMSNTSQCELRSLRVNSGMLNVIRNVTYYTLPPLESPDSFWIAMAFSR